MEKKANGKKSGRKANLKVVPKVEQQAQGAGIPEAPEASACSADQTIASAFHKQPAGDCPQMRDAEGRCSHLAGIEQCQERKCCKGCPEPCNTQCADATCVVKKGAAEGLVFEDLVTGAIIKGAPEPEAPVKITLKRSEITEALKVCQETLGSVAPALSHVLIAASGRLWGDECVVSATNLETSYSKVLSCVTQGPVTALAPAKTLLAEIKALPPEITDVELSITGGNGARAVSVNGRCSIHALDPEEFPTLPTGFDNIVKVRNLKEATARGIMVVSKDELRYALTGMFLDLAGGAAVGTDGFRLHFEEIEAASPPKGALLVPANAMKMLLKFKGEDEVRFALEGDGKHVAFSIAGGILSARLMDGAYPEYKEVVPKPEMRPERITFAAAEFLKLIEGAAPLSDKAIRLTINGDLLVTSEHQAGKYEWRIPCTREGSDAKLVYHFNPAFLVDAMKAYPADRVTLAMPKGGDYAAVVVNDKAVVMPQRI
jgi:DNA polymerase-3 subunit beta